jgi:hypothetical protein
MEDRIRPDYSIRVNFGEESVLVDRVYDNVHLFRWLGHGILKVIMDEGLGQWHMPEQQAEYIADNTGIIPVERQDISEREYDAYLRFQEASLGDSWLND